jgi:paraquat-inducible protein A
MKIETEEDLDKLIICHKCHTLHREVPIRNGSKACCRECGTVLYRYDTRLIDHGLALSITALIFFVLANSFPLVKIEILGHEQFLTIPGTFISFFDSGFYIVGMMVIFLIFIFPLMVTVIYILLFLLLKFRRNPDLVKNLLILLAKILPWSMTDIFFVSIFVALVKLIGYAQIHMGISLGALAIFVLLDLYVSYKIHLGEIWMLRKRMKWKGSNNGD